MRQSILVLRMTIAHRNRWTQTFEYLMCSELKWKCHVYKSDNSIKKMHLDMTEAQSTIMSAEFDLKDANAGKI